MQYINLSDLLNDEVYTEWAIHQNNFNFINCVVLCRLSTYNNNIMC